MNKQQARELLKKYNDGTATSEEKDLVESWFLKLKAEQQSHDLPNDAIEDDTNEVWLALKEIICQPNQFGSGHALPPPLLFYYSFRQAVIFFA